MSETTAESEMPCPGCGYDLRGHASGAAGETVRCPECGRGWPVDDLRDEAEIPWQWRRPLARRMRPTLRLALLQPGRLGRQAGKRVDYRAARRFQVVACLLAWPALAGPLAAAILLVRQPHIAGWWRAPGGAPQVGPSLQWLPDITGHVLDGMLIAAACLGVLLWLILATGVPSYFFHPRRLERPRQDAAVAVSYYASAAVLLAWPVVLLWGLLWLVAFIAATERMDEWPGRLPHVVGIFAAIAAAVWTLVLPALVLKGAVEASRRRRAACVVVTAVGWLVLLVVCVAGPAALGLWAQVMYHAFTA